MVVQAVNRFLLGAGSTSHTSGGVRVTSTCSVSNSVPATVHSMRYRTASLTSPSRTSSVLAIRKGEVIAQVLGDGAQQIVARGRSTLHMVQVHVH